jgi:hypothetical protein
VAKIGLQIDGYSRIIITDPVLMAMERAYTPMAGGAPTNRTELCSAIPNTACTNMHRSCADGTNDACTNYRPCMQRADDRILE